MKFASSDRRKQASPLLAGAAWIIVLAALICVIALARQVPVLDRDEARFAQASAQMLETGDYVQIRFQEQARNKKPIGIYWLQALSVDLFSNAQAREIVYYRIPSILGFALAILAVWGMGRHLWNSDIASVAAGLYALCPLPFIEGMIGKTDSMLSGVIALCAWCLVLIWYRPAGHQARWAGLGFWAALAVSVLIKGPIGPLIIALGLGGFWLWQFWARMRNASQPVATLQAGARNGARDWQPVLRLSGVLLFCALIAPWFIAIERATNGAFLREALGQDLGPKLVGGQEGHGGFFGLHALAMGLLAFPASMFILPGLWRAWRLATQLRFVVGSEPGASEPRGEGAMASAFLLALIIPGWLVFEALPTKLLHYTLPFYPFLALLGAVHFCRPRSRTARISMPATKAAAVPIIAMAVGSTLLSMAPGLILVGLGPLLGPVLATGRFDASAWSTANFPFVSAGLVFALGLAAQLHARGLGRRLAWRGPHIHDERWNDERWTQFLQFAFISATGLLLFSALPGIAKRAAPAMAIEQIMRAVHDPALRPDGPEPQGADIAAGAPPARSNASVLVAGYAEPSLVFRLGTQTRLISLAQIAEEASPGALLIANLLAEDERADVTEVETRIRAQLSEKGLDWTTIAPLRAHNYSKGDPLILLMGRLTRSSAPQTGGSNLH